MTELVQVVGGIFINKERKMLFQLRDDKPSIPYPNYWALLGGHLECNETPLEALEREIMEEIEYKIKNPMFIGTFNDGLENLMYVFKLKIDKEVNELKLHEGQKIDYFSFEDLLLIKAPESLKKFLVKHKEKIMSY